LLEFFSSGSENTLQTGQKTRKADSRRYMPGMTDKYAKENEKNKKNGQPISASTNARHNRRHRRA
jgi:hypothetical protein